VSILGGLLTWGRRRTARAGLGSLSVGATVGRMNEVLSHRLRVAEVIVETDDAHTVVFEPTPDQAPYFRFLPGQFLTLRIPSELCGSVARCYSLCNSPFSGELPRVTVKRTPDGYASNWVHDNVRAGSEVEVLEPAGLFTPADLGADLLLCAAGSGITPVMSIIAAALAEGDGRIALLYANRDERSVIFATTLRKLAAEYPERLTVVHWLESVQGLPSEPALRGLTAPYTDREAFLCGPKPFMAAVRTALRDLGMAKDRVHLERFASLGGDPFEQATLREKDTTDHQ
jgi:3-ketosteroid 9alpha-monooxygenase subunit B